jgi:hypothetical protein
MNNGLLRMAYLRLSTSISTSETVWENLSKQLMRCPKQFSAYFHKLSKIAYYLYEKGLILFFVIEVSYK